MIYSYERDDLQLLKVKVYKTKNVSLKNGKDFESYMF